MSVMNFLYGIFSADAKKGGRIGAREAHELVASQTAILVDVREESELRAEGIAEPALWLATSEIQARGPRYQEFLSGLPKEKKVIIYCAAGVRAGRFATELQALGYETANMGGFSSWSAARLSIRTWKD